MQGMILAAGMGKRLKELTKDNTKCMVKVNGVTLIERMLRQMDKLYLSRIVVVVGYKGQKLVDYIGTLQIKTPVCFVNNPVYDRTNNIYSLALAKEYLVREDTLLLESDLIFEEGVLSLLLEDERETLALVDKYESWMDGTCMRLREDDSIEAFVPGKRLAFEDTSVYYKTVNVYKFSRYFSETHYVPFLEAYVKALGDNEYYEQVLRVIATLDEPGIKAKRLEGQLWYEIDDIQDLDIASSMFAKDGAEKARGMQARYGGYWRYPRLKDFCYLVNPYFPTERLMSEMEANFRTLLTQYPSGIRVNSLLGAKNFGVRQEHILTGNGAAELIKGLMKHIEGRIGFIRPTFDEYLNRWDAGQSVLFDPEDEGLRYTADEVMAYFEGKEISTLVLINPDNPSGNYISKADVLQLATWCRERNIRLVLDESFVDFAEEEDATMLKEEILSLYEGLVVIKSISKSYGVPGIRLGVLASADEGLVACLKREMAIWNINSFGEFYMQIWEKYRKDYEASLAKVKEARRRLIQGLKENTALTVFPSQANYVMAEIINGVSAEELTGRLLAEHQILIKDLSSKIKRDGRQFIRLAVRDERDNEKLLTVLREEL